MSATSLEPLRKQICIFAEKHIYGDRFSCIIAAASLSQNIFLLLCQNKKIKTEHKI